MEPGEPSGGWGSGGTLSHSRTICSNITFSLHGEADSLQFASDFIEDFGEVGAVGGGGSFVAFVTDAAHAGIQEIAHGFMVGEAFEGHFRVAAAGGLNFDACEAEPAFDG